MYISTLYVGIGHVKNSHLYVRYGSSLEKTTANCDKIVTDKRPCLSIVKCPKSSAIPRIKTEKNKHENLDFVILSSSCITQKPQDAYEHSTFCLFLVKASHDPQTVSYDPKHSLAARLSLHPPIYEGGESGQMPIPSLFPTR